MKLAALILVAMSIPMVGQLPKVLAQESRIEKVMIYSAKWDEDFDVIQTPKSLLAQQGKVVEIVLSESLFFKEFESLLSQLAPKEKPKIQDVRIAVLVYRSDSTVDTLSLSSFEQVTLNAGAFELDERLFDLVTRYIPYDHKIRMEFVNPKNFRFVQKIEN